MVMFTRAPLTQRQAAEEIEQLGDDLCARMRAFDRTCEGMPKGAIDRINAITGQDSIDIVAEAFRKLGAQMSEECDVSEVEAARHTRSIINFNTGAA